MSSAAPADRREIPVGNAAGFVKYLSSDLLSGFLVFLIALPLCLSIALAYGYPPVAGIFTAVIGGILTTFISNSELTIKGPAAGLIVIAAGCVTDFGGDGVVGGFTEVDQHAYELALGVGVAAGVIQILFGVFRAGGLGDFFPSSVVHGMLAAIGVIIIIKMLPVTLGVTVKGTPFALLLGADEIASHYHRDIAIVGVVSLAIMFLWPLLKKVKVLGSIPSALIVVLVAIPLSQALHLGSAHTNSVSLTPAKAEPTKLATVTPPEAEVVAATDSDETPAAEPKPTSDTLVKVPPFGETFSALTFPDFSGLKEPFAWKWVIMFALIGTVESMLSAKAMDIIDPWRRRTSLDRDNLAIGVANTACAFVGAPPMISEIVRSRANLDNGARTRFADMWHGLFLLVFVCLLPFVIGMIPIAALSAMLIYTGFRLASPREFMHVFHIGVEQLIIYVTTIVGVFAIDLLSGVAIGIAVKLIIHLVNGVPITSLFKAYTDTEQTSDDTYTIRAKRSAVFSNWIPLRRQLMQLGLAEKKNVNLDLSDTRLVDHSVMERLHQMERLFKEEGLKLEICGLEEHKRFSNHELAARRRPKFSQVESNGSPRPADPVGR